MSKRWLLALVAALVIYLGLGLAFGIHDLGSTLQRLPLWWWLVAPAVALLSHALLFQRWQFYLRRLGFPLAWRPSARIYAAGLALIAAPGRSGEALRGLWLQRRHGIPLQVGVGITLAERLADLASALLVLSWGIGQRVWAAVLVGLLVLAAGGWVLTHPGVIRRLEQGLERLPLHPRWHGLNRLLRESLLAVTNVRQLMRPRPLLVGTLLACLCWLMEAGALQGIYGGLGIGLTLHQTAVIRTAAALGGVLSLLPAGLGTSEATAIGLAMAYGADRSEALAATLVLRVATLAVPCLAGLLCLVLQPDLQRLKGHHEGIRSTQPIP
ncbi:MAG: lysylphosphatidylglycerol synthase transmembrane domain-containing protein [Synechococcus sp. ELA057]